MHLRRCVPLTLLALLACGDSSTDPTPPGPPDEPEIPRADYELLVERFSSAGQRSYYSMAPDGTQVAPLPGIPATVSGLAAAPDGRSIAYLLPTVDSDQHLWVMDRDGSHPRPVLEGTRVITHVEWSPDGSHFVISASTFEESDDLFVLRADGSGLVNITPDPKPAIVADRHPTWSPDGSAIAFQSNRDGISQLWIVQADGSNPRRVMPDAPRTEIGPAWSALLDLIAFVVPGEGIGFVRPDGTEERVVPIGGSPGRLAWAPDGRLLFSADVFGDLEVFALDPSGGEPVNLSRHPGQDLRAVALVYVEPTGWKGFTAPTWIVADRPEPVGIAAGDVVYDGRPDLLVLDEAFEAVRVLRGRDQGEFELVGSLDAAGPHRALATADLSRDDIDDLVVLFDDAFLVWRGAAEGPTAPTTHALGGTASGLVVYDFDGDGNADVAGIHAASGTGFRMLVHGSRDFDGELIAILDYPSTFPGPGRATAADVTGDGAGDVVVLTSAPEAPVVLVPGQGDITFGAAVVASTQVSADLDAIPLAADLDGDRRADLVLLYPGEGGRLEVLRSLGTSFAAPVTIAIEASSVVSGDFDRDGDVDLVVTQPAVGALAFLRNRGNGQFARAVSVPVDATVRHAVAADLDADTWLDLAVVDTEGAVGVLTNRRR